MVEKDKQGDLLQNYSKRLLETIQQRAGKGPRSYGFEYEFLPKEPLTMDIMEEIYSFLPSCGFLLQEGRFVSTTGIYITFEPGGQIEYHSTPMQGGDKLLFHQSLSQIEETNNSILKAVGVQYLAVGYIHGRGGAPLCLTSNRYKNLHARMATSGTRGREMMKGTASIHFHVGIRQIRELAPLFLKLCELSLNQEFRMSPDRKDIWDNTDPSRCGQAVCSNENIRNSQELGQKLVRFALEAEDISENIPFQEKEDATYNKFLYHMTTIFTDVRLNLTGTTLELRTPDSMPSKQFEKKWKKFTNIIEKV